MDKNSLIQDIKNDLNSIKKQVEVTLAKLEVLEALIKLEVRSEELGVKEEPKPEPIAEPEPVVEEESEQEIVEIEQVIELEIDDKVEEEEITPHSSLLTPNSEKSTPISEAPAELRNLMSVIGLNDRFRFRHDLFSDSNDLFKETIEILNAIENFDKAVDYLQEKFNWDEEDATVVYFYDIIKPKF